MKPEDFDQKNKIVELKTYREEILPALTLATKIAEQRSTIPILRCVRIKAVDHHAVVVGTDLDFWMRVPFPTNGDVTTFDIVVNHKQLLAAIKAAPKGCEVMMSYDTSVKLRTRRRPMNNEELCAINPDPTQVKGEDHCKDEVAEGYTLVVEVGGQTLKLDTYPIGDWPDDYKIGKEIAQVTIDAPSFARDLKRALIAVSTKETRYCLNGVYVHEAQGKLVLAAADGHRLIKIVHTEMPFGQAHFDAILPTRAIHAWLAFMEASCPQSRKGRGQQANTVGEIIVAANRAMALRIGGTMIEGKTIDGTFPNYDRLIPHASARPLSIVVDRKAMINTIKRVGTMEGERGAPIKLVVETSERIQLEVKHHDTDATCIALEADVEGAPDGRTGVQGFEIGLSGVYLAGMLGGLTGDRVTMRFADASSSILIEDRDCPGTALVLMPHRV